MTYQATLLPGVGLWTRPSGPPMGYRGGSGHSVPLAWGVWGPEEADLCPGRMPGSWCVRGQPGAPHLYKEDSGAACQHPCWETEKRSHGAQHTRILRPCQHLSFCAQRPRENQGSPAESSNPRLPNFTAHRKHLDLVRA